MRVALNIPLIVAPCKKGDNYCISFVMKDSAQPSPQSGAPVAEWVKCWPTDLADPV